MTRLVRLAAYRAVALQGKTWEWMTSDAIGSCVGVNPTQVRRDLSDLGSLGKRGSGYELARLAERLDSEIRPHRDVVKAEVERTLATMGRIVSVGLS